MSLSSNILHFQDFLLAKMQVCNVCREQTPKYKCPGCKIRYCSVGCYKKHKDSCLPVQPPEPSGPEVKPASSSAVCADLWSVEDLLNEDDLIDKVPVEKLQLLGRSDQLRDLLRNPHLRQLLRSVDAADSKEDAMKAAMQEPLFVEFSDCCLNIVEDRTTPTHI